jgi:hypothetical protein
MSDTDTEKLPPSLEGKLPAQVENAGDIARLTIGVMGACLSRWAPVTAALGTTVLSLVNDRSVIRPQRLILEELRKGNVQNLSHEQLAAFIPMGYKFFEAARQGEYEHNLSILAAYLTGELKQDVPDPANFSRMVRRVEGLSSTDLKGIALADAFLSEVAAASPDAANRGFAIGASLLTDAGARGKRPYVTASALTASPLNKTHLTHTDIEEALVDLAARGPPCQ